MVAWSQGLALVLLTVVLRGARVRRARRAGCRWALAAGVAGSGALVCFYAALSTGTMGVVAPVASLGVVVPVLLGVVDR